MCSPHAAQESHRCVCVCVWRIAQGAVLVWTLPNAFTAIFVALLIFDGVIVSDIFQAVQSSKGPFSIIQLFFFKRGSIIHDPPPLLPKLEKQAYIKPICLFFKKTNKNVMWLFLHSASFNPANKRIGLDFCKIHLDFMLPTPPVCGQVELFVTVISFSLAATPLGPDRKRLRVKSTIFVLRVNTFKHPGRAPPVKSATLCRDVEGSGRTCSDESRRRPSVCKGGKMKGRRRYR